MHYLHISVSKWILKNILRHQDSTCREQINTVTSLKRTELPELPAGGNSLQFMDKKGS